MSLLASWLQRRWYSDQPAPAVLLPLAWLYGRIAASRRKRLTAEAPLLPVPVIVVGNISLGGTGKTPFVIWLVDCLRELGWHPGVISRGYGGSSEHYPLFVDAQSDPVLCGDEPCLIAARTGVPVAVAPDRVAAARFLLARAEAPDVLIADDGLQHYRLRRDLEICLVDGTRGLGNGALLPAGPLREPPQRLCEVSLIVANGGTYHSDAAPLLRMQLRGGRAVSLTTGQSRPVTSFAGAVHGVAGLGNPQRFFDSLRDAGLEVIEHAFADHHAYQASDLDFGGDLPVLMTEKDAVKCRAFADARLWSVPVSAAFGPDDEARVRQLLLSLKTT